ncbi:hypothetical protein KFE25_006944 [Diacronema lutheri]|uniref:PLOD1-3-like GT domain-containing protein n=1 Tax=Diacronema lutheri TaxID=2081491 RepID=A0A8J5XSW1_DIALT|nr:hypothetical protein KFE25_006944 [Diacronema lutheri]
MFTRCAGVILHNTRPNPTAPSVVVLTHYDKDDWREKCAPLLFSLRHAAVDFIVGYLDERLFDGAARRHAECQKSEECASRERRQVFNNMNKFIWAYDVVSSRAAVHPDSLVIFADCTDTYLVCSADELERKFDAFDAGIVHGAEVALWPYDRMQKLIRKHQVKNPYPAAPTPLRYGNTGQYAGRARDVARYFVRQREAWESGTPWTWCCPTGLRYVRPDFPGPELNETDCFNDQRCIHTYVAAGFHADGTGPRIVFDALADLFLNANKMVPRITTVGPRIHFNLSQALAPSAPRWAAQVWMAPRQESLPCWIHCSGVAKGLFTPVARALMRAAKAGVAYTGRETPLRAVGHAPRWTLAPQAQRR